MSSNQTPNDRLPTHPVQQSSVPWLAAIALMAIAGVPSIVLAQWPSDPASPLLFGDMQPFPNGLDHTVTSTPDGATWIGWVDSYCQGAVRVQRIAANGSMLEPGGFFVENDLGCGVTFPPLLTACSDNSVVINRVNGGLGDARLHRIGADGDRMWGPNGIAVEDQGNSGTIGGVAVAPLGVFTSHFDGGWTEETYTLAVSDESTLNGASVNVYRVHRDGTMSPHTTAVSGTTPAGPVHATLLNNRFVAVTWLDRTSNPTDLLAAQRLNPIGTLDQIRRRFWRLDR